MTRFALSRSPLLASLPELVRRGIGQAVDLVFPPHCAMCRRPVLSGPLCDECRENLIDTRPACPRCGAGGLVNQAGRCFRCQDERYYFESVVRLGRYEGSMRRAVLRMKRERHRALAIAAGRLLVETCQAQLDPLKVDAVVPIPTHWSRRVWRGVNGPDGVAEQLASHLRVPLADHLLRRRRRTVPQARLSPTRRLANVRGAFRASAHRDLVGARILLVDDIMTTGATVNEAAKMLVKAGASFVAIAVLARAEGS